MQAPGSFDPVDHVRYLVKLDRPLSRDDIMTAALCCGRNNAPWIVYHVATLSRVPLRREVAAWVVPDAWSAAEFPQRRLSQANWREIFLISGYSNDGVPAERPAEPLVLYRGSAKAHRRRWSW